MPRHPRLTRRSGVALALGLSMLAAACGGDADDSATSTTAGAATAATEAAGGEAAPSSDGVAEAEKLVAEAMAPVSFTAPDGVGQIDFAKLKGKKVAIINLVKAVPILTQWEAEMTAAFEGSGVTLTSFDGKFDPNEWGRGIQQAIAEKVDLIFLLGIPPGAVKPQIAEAKKAGIPIMTSLQGTPGKSLAEVPDLTADVGFDYRIPGKMLAWWFVADSKGKGNALIMSSDDNESSPDVWGAMESEIERLCPDCKVTREDSTVPEWSDGTLQQRTKALIQADPEIDYILAVFDGMALAIEPGLVEAGAADRVKVAGFNGTPAVMAQVQKGTAVKMDVGNPNMWFSAGAVDAILTTLSGGKPIEDAGVPFRIFTEENIKPLDTSKEDALDWYGIDPKTEYRKLWGLES